MLQFFMPGQAQPVLNPQEVKQFDQTVGGSLRSILFIVVFTLEGEQEPQFPFHVTPSNCQAAYRNHCLNLTLTDVRRNGILDQTVAAPISAFLSW